MDCICTCTPPPYDDPDCPEHGTQSYRARIIWAARAMEEAGEPVDYDEIKRRLDAEDEQLRITCNVEEAMRLTETHVDCADCQMLHPVGQHTW